jgi:5'-deoxynucleotidase
MQPGVNQMFHFYAMLSRMKYINRWGLMRNTRSENLCEHSFETAVLAHALAVLRNTRFGGHADPERTAVLALFHDASEILTGDLPTPVKYYNPKIRTAYREVEAVAQNKLLSLLPDDLKPSYEPVLAADGDGDQALLPLVKAADKLSAIIKCMEESRMGNTEFSKAEATLLQAVRDMHLPEADCFVEEFLPSYRLTLDEQD